MVSSQWYLYKDGRQQGPYSWEDLYRQAEAGSFGPADLIWTEGMENWSRADRVRGLFTAPSYPATPSPASLLSPASNCQLKGSANYQASLSRKQGKGGLVLLLIMLVLVLAVGVFFAVSYLLNDLAGEIVADPLEPGIEERTEDRTETTDKVFIRAAEVEGITDELAAVIDHMINQGIEVVSVNIIRAFTTDAVAGVSVSTNETFFELIQYDLETADEATLNYLETLDEEYSLLNGNIMMAKPDRWGEDEPEYYTKAVEEVIEAFISF